MRFRTARRYTGIEARELAKKRSEEWPTLSQSNLERVGHPARTERSDCRFAPTRRYHGSQNLIAEHSVLYACRVNRKCPNAFLIVPYLHDVADRGTLVVAFD